MFVKCTYRFKFMHAVHKIVNDHNSSKYKSEALYSIVTVISETCEIISHGISQCVYHVLCDIWHTVHIYFLSLEAVNHRGDYMYVSDILEYFLILGLLMSSMLCEFGH